MRRASDRRKGSAKASAANAVQMAMFDFAPFRVLADNKLAAPSVEDATQRRNEGPTQPLSRPVDESESSDECANPGAPAEVLMDNPPAHEGKLGGATQVGGVPKRALLARGSEAPPKSAMSTEPMAYSIDDACRLLGIRRNLFYDEAKRVGGLRITKIGRRSVVLASDLRAYVDSLRLR